LEKKYNHAGEVTVKDTYDSFPLKNQKYYLRYYLDDTKQNMFIKLILEKDGWIYHLALRLQFTMTKYI
jgi:hypothetical protein